MGYDSMKNRKDICTKLYIHASLILILVHLKLTHAPLVLTHARLVLPMTAWYSSLNHAPLILPKFQLPKYHSLLAMPMLLTEM